MRGLIKTALLKYEEVIRALDALDRKDAGFTVEEHNNYVIWSAQKEEIKQAIIEYTVSPMSQTAHSVIEAVGEEAISFAQVQVNK